METKNAVLSVAYLAPVQYYTKLILYKNVLIEQHENYSKQSYRNRCVIVSANGPLTLSIPAERADTLKIAIKDVKIDYQTNWQKIHRKAIESAYQNAPYFQFYFDDLLPFYTKKYNFLFDFNLAIQEVILKSLELDILPQFTEDFFVSYSEAFADFRDSIHPKQRLHKPDEIFSPCEYPQVFDQKFSFIPNMSILDLLFNTGPDAKDILLKSAV